MIQGSAVIGPSTPMQSSNSLAVLRSIEMERERIPRRPTTNWPSEEMCMVSSADNSYGGASHKRNMKDRHRNAILDVRPSQPLVHDKAMGTTLGIAQAELLAVHDTHLKHL